MRRSGLAIPVALAALAIGCNGSDSIVDGDENFGLRDDGSCAGTAGDATVENLKVEDGETCTLDGTVITGNLFVYTGASLFAQDITVGGNIQADGAATVEVAGSTVVDGNVQIKQGGSARLESLRIHADLQLEQNDGPVVALDNQVEGNMQVFQNTGGVTLTGNQVAENLQCKENTPAPTGGGNVAGDKEDQCAGL